MARRPLSRPAACSRKAVAWGSPQQRLHAGQLVVEALVAVGAGVDRHGGEDPRAAHRVHGGMAGLDRRHHRPPLPLDAGAIGVQPDREPALLQHPLEGQQGAATGQGRDPLGRGAAPFGESGVKIPGASDLARSREIFQELPRRAAQMNRPQAERDYLDRLLKAF